MIIQGLLVVFNELKDYIKNYPYSMKYNVDDAEVQEIASKVIEDWTRQYKELSNFVMEQTVIFSKRQNTWMNLNL